MDAITQQFLERVSREAIAARDSGNVAQVAALSADPALKHYLENVAFLGSMTPDQYEYWYKPQMTRIGDLAHAYQEAEQQKKTVSGLEDKVDKLMHVVEAMLETQSPAKRAKIQEAVATATETDDEDAEEAEQGPEATAPGDQPEEAADEAVEPDEEEEEEAATS
jgi:hypothetical protein